VDERQILERAIQKSIDGGWNAELHGTTLRKIGKDGRPYAWIGVSTWANRDLIFSHDFAKALWGDEPWDALQGELDHVRSPKWMCRLQQMVIADDPIKYLGDNLGE